MKLSTVLRNGVRTTEFKKIDKHIEIVSSSIIGLSSMSQKSRDAIRETLAKHYTKVGISIVNNISDLEVLVLSKPDLVFLGMSFIPVNPLLGRDDPNKIWLSLYLKDRGIAITGSDQEAHQLENDKPSSKYCVLTAGLKTSPFLVVKQHQQPAIEDITLNYPLFIKPTNRGGGLGVDSKSLVNNFAELKAKVESITSELRSDSLIEEYLPGREFSVAIMKNWLSGDFSIMPIELIAPKDENGIRILSSEVKSSDTETFSGVTDSNKSAVTNLAMKVFNILGARDYGRIDIRLDKYGTPHFLEANLIPSLICDYGNFPKACLLNAGIGYEEMILSIVRLGFNRAVVPALNSANKDEMTFTDETASNVLANSGLIN